MKKTMILSGVLILALGGASLASAAGMQHGKGHGPRGMDVDQMFEQLDANKDGQITKEEMQAAGAMRFAATDTDGDGFLSAEELAAADAKREAERQKRKGDRVAWMLEKLDANKDGKLSQEEMEARGGQGKGKGKGDRGMRMFDHADANGDGALTKEELEAAKAQMGKRKGRHGGGNKG